MKKDRLRTFTLLLLGVAGILASAGAQERIRIGARISYVSGLTAYLAAGREQGLAAGDSARVVRGRRPGVLLVISAVSGSSASARPAGDTLSFEIGDSVVVEKAVTPPERPVARASGRLAGGGSAEGSGISGSAALQFAGALESGGGWTFIQPALLLRLNVPGLVGG